MLTISKLVAAAMITAMSLTGCTSFPSSPNDSGLSENALIGDCTRNVQINIESYLSASDVEILSATLDGDPAASATISGEWSGTAESGRAIGGSLMCSVENGEIVADDNWEWDFKD